ncbi:MAG: sigma-E factor negative regulatory protein [Planctomycetota bacterium]|nr:sigma-E factor negative regulatory protein [Planctomycetota bacterium]
MNRPTPSDELLSAYVDGELSSAETEWIEDWLRENPHGQERVAHYRLLGGAMRGLPSAELPAEFPARVLRSIERDMLLPRRDTSPGSRPTAAPSPEKPRQRSWLRWGVQILAPLSATALGLLVLFSNILPESPFQGLATSEPKSSPPGIADHAPPPMAVPTQLGDPSPSAATRAMSMARTVTSAKSIEEFAAALDTQHTQPERVVLVTIEVAASDSVTSLGAIADRQQAIQTAVEAFQRLNFKETPLSEERSPHRDIARASDKEVLEPGSAAPPPGDRQHQPMVPGSENTALLMMAVGETQAIVDAFADMLDRDENEAIVLSVAKTELTTLSLEQKELVGDFYENATQFDLASSEAGDADTTQASDEPHGDPESTREKGIEHLRMFALVTMPAALTSHKSDFDANSAHLPPAGPAQSTADAAPLPHELGAKSVPAPAGLALDPAPVGDSPQLAERKASSPKRPAPANKGGFGGGGMGSSAQVKSKQSPISAAKSAADSTENNATVHGTASRILIQFVVRPGGEPATAAPAPK